MSNILHITSNESNRISEIQKIKLDLLAVTNEAMSKIDEIFHEQELDIRLREARNLPFKTYKTKEAAELIHISTQQLAKLARQGEIPCAKIGNSYVFRESALIEFQLKAERGEVKLHDKDDEDL